MKIIRSNTYRKIIILVNYDIIRFKSNIEVKLFENTYVQLNLWR